MRRVYLDSSAFLKLVVVEPESGVLRRWFRGRPWTSAALLRAEVLRALRPHGSRATQMARRMMDRGELIRLSPALLDLSASLGPPELRTLDAIHVAAARMLGDELGVVVTYDRRLAFAARSLGMRVASPA